MIDDSLPIWVDIEPVKQCDCCGRTHMKRTLCISSPEFNPIHLGYICAGRWFEINLTGNAYKAKDKLQDKINKMNHIKLMSILDRVQAGDSEE